MTSYSDSLSWSPWAGGTESPVEKTPALEAALPSHQGRQTGPCLRRGPEQSQHGEFRVQTFHLPAVKSFSGLISPIG